MSQSKQALQLVTDLAADLRDPGFIWQVVARQYFQHLGQFLAEVGLGVETGAPPSVET